MGPSFVSAIAGAEIQNKQQSAGCKLVACGSIEPHKVFGVRLDSFTLDLRRGSSNVRFVGVRMGNCL